MALKRTWAFLTHVVTEYGRDNCNQLAAAISYYVLFSIVPFTVFVVSVFGLVKGGNRLQQDVTPAVVDFVGLRQGSPIIEVREAPVAALYGRPAVAEIANAVGDLSPDEAAALADRLTGSQPRPVTLAGRQLTDKELSIRYDNSVSNTLRDVSRISAPLTIVGLIAMAWSGSAMFGAVRRALNAVWKVQVQRPFFQQKLQDLLMGAGLGVLLLASLAGTGLLRVLRDLSDEALGPLSPNTGIFWAMLPFVLPFLFSFMVFSLIFRYVPAARVEMKDAWLGAVVASLLFEVLKNAFAFYVANFRAYDIIYGSLGGILLFLTSVYISAAILLFCGEVTLAHPRLVAGEFDPVIDPSRPYVPFLKRASRDVGRFIRGLFVAPVAADGAGGKEVTPTPRRQR